MSYTENIHKPHLVILIELDDTVQLKELATVLHKNAGLSKYRIKCLLSDMPRVVCRCNTLEEALSIQSALEHHGCRIVVEPLAGNVPIDIQEAYYRSLKKELSRVLRSKVSLTLVYGRIENKNSADITPSILGPMGKKLESSFRESDTLYPLNDTSFFLVGFSTDVDGAEALQNKVVLALKTTIGETIDVTVGNSVFPDQARTILELISGASESAETVNGMAYTGVIGGSIGGKGKADSGNREKGSESTIQLYFTKARGRLFRRFLSLETHELWAGISTLPKANQEAFVYRLPYDFPLAPALEQIVRSHPRALKPDAVVNARLEEIIYSMDLESSLTERYNTQEEILVKLNKTDALPVLPSVAQKIIGIISDPDSSMDSLTRIIETDSTLTLKILKIVNSAFFGYTQKIDNVKEALVILGYEEILNLALGLAVAKKLDSAQLEGCVNPETLWHHSIGTALIAQHLSKKLPEFKSASAFTAGLLHDFGKIFMVEHFPDLYRRIHLDSLKYKLPLYEVEEEVCNINHAKVGEVIAAKFGLPHDLVLSIAKHHQFLKKDRYSDFSAMICLADYLCHAADKTESADVASALTKQFTYGHYSVLTEIFKPFNEEIIESLVEEASVVLEDNKELFAT